MNEKKEKTEDRVSDRIHKSFKRNDDFIKNTIKFLFSFFNNTFYNRFILSLYK